MKSHKDVKPVSALDPYRFAKADPADQRAFVVKAVHADPVAVAVLERSATLNLPDWALCAGAIYQNVWNALTGRAPGYGIRDYDLAYCDLSDLSWESEDRVIQHCQALFSDLPSPVEVRNQARVHLWFEAKFGEARAPITSTQAALSGYAARAHMVGMTRDRDGVDRVLAPIGLEAVFSMTLAAARRSGQTEQFQAKIQRMKALWPEIRIA